MGTIGDKPPHPTKKMVTSLYKKRFPYYSLHITEIIFDWTKDIPLNVSGNKYFQQKLFLFCNKLVYKWISERIQSTTQAYLNKTVKR